MALSPHYSWTLLGPFLFVSPEIPVPDAEAHPLISRWLVLGETGWSESFTQLCWRRSYRLSLLKIPRPFGKCASHRSLPLSGYHFASVAHALWATVTPKSLHSRKQGVGRRQELCVSLICPVGIAIQPSCASPPAFMLAVKSAQTINDHNFCHLVSDWGLTLSM